MEFSKLLASGKLDRLDGTGSTYVQCLFIDFIGLCADEATMVILPEQMAILVARNNVIEIAVEADLST